VTYPAKPVRPVPFAPVGSMSRRIIADAHGDAGQPFIVENRLAPADRAPRLQRRP
jgi:hypothetical protein